MHARRTVAQQAMARPRRKNVGMALHGAATISQFQLQISAKVAVRAFDVMRRRPRPHSVQLAGCVCSAPRGLRHKRAFGQQLRAFWPMVSTAGLFSSRKGVQRLGKAKAPRGHEGRINIHTWQARGACVARCRAAALQCIQRNVAYGPRWRSRRAGRGAKRVTPEIDDFSSCAPCAETVCGV